MGHAPRPFRERSRAPAALVLPFCGSPSIPFRSSCSLRVLPARGSPGQRSSRPAVLPAGGPPCRRSSRPAVLPAGGPPCQGFSRPTVLQIFLASVLPFCRSAALPLTNALSRSTPPISPSRRTLSRQSRGATGAPPLPAWPASLGLSARRTCPGSARADNRGAGRRRASGLALAKPEQIRTGTAARDSQGRGSGVFADPRRGQGGPAAACASSALPQMGQVRKEAGGERARLLSPAVHAQPRPRAGRADPFRAPAGGACPADAAPGQGRAAGHAGKHGAGGRPGAEPPRARGRPRPSGPSPEASLLRTSPGSPEPFSVFPARRAGHRTFQPPLLPSDPLLRNSCP
jgi:hypothetical protein